MKSLFLLTCFLLGALSDTTAQRYRTPTEYMNKIGEDYAQLSVQFYRYLSAVAHANSARRVEKKRKQLLETSWNTYTKVRTMPLYEGNRSLRDSAAHFLNINHRVLKEDFDMILDMELIAEQSYDDMEAYLMAQREARNKLDVANIKMLVEQRKFASAFGLDLVVRDDAIYEKMKETNVALNHLNTIYLSFFRCHKQEIYLLDALTSKDIAAIELNRRLLLGYISSAKETLNRMPPFDGDQHLEGACNRILQFYEHEAQNDVKAMIAFIDAENSFIEAKEIYDALSKEERTAETVGIYNQAVRTMNDAADHFNAGNQVSNAKRADLMNAWREAYDLFLDRHVPYF